MTTAQTVAVSAAAGAAVAIAIGALGLFGRGHAAVSATIVFRDAGGTCTADVLPATVIVGKNDVVNWTVTGSCPWAGGFDANEVTLELYGTCQPNGGKVASSTPPLDDVFDSPAALKGRKIRRKIKWSDDDRCFTYRILHKGSQVGDPELEIITF